MNKVVITRKHQNRAMAIMSVRLHQNRTGEIVFDNRKMKFSRQMFKCSKLCYGIQVDWANSGQLFLFEILLTGESEVL